MIRLDNNTRTLQVLLGGAVATTELDVVCSYKDEITTTQGQIRSGGATRVVTTAGASARTVADAPSQSQTIRVVEFISIRNNDTASVILTLRYNDNSTTYKILTWTMAVGDTLIYTLKGFELFDSSGQFKQSLANASTLTVTTLLDLTGGQIKFPATQVASNDANTLDDYEEGTFTPILTDGTNNATSSDADGRYVKIGRSVSFWFDYTCSSLGSVSGSVFFSGLPFTETTGIAAPVAVGRCAGLNVTAGQNVSGHVASADTRVTLELWDNAAGDTALQGTEWSATGVGSFSGVMFASA